LWSEADHARRSEFEAPEVHRVDLAEAALLLKAAGVSEIREFRWFNPPTEESLSRAERLLHDLGALDSTGKLTDEGRKMASLPLDPRFSRLMLAGYEHGCVAETAFIAATVQGDGIFTNKRGGPGRKDFIFPDDDSDFAGEWRAFESAEAMGFDPRRCDPVGVMARGARETAQGFDRLCSLAKRFGWEWQPVDFKARRESVGKAMLAAFSDQLAIRISQGTLACKLVGNRKGKLDEDSCVRNAPAFVAAEITEVEAREIIVHLRRATAVDPAWLTELFPEDLAITDGATWDETRRRVVARKETRFRDLVLEAKESDHGVNLDAAAEILAARVLSGELDLKNWDHSVEQWTARLASLGNWMPELEMPGWTDEDRTDAIAQICHGAVSYKEIKEANVWRVLREWLSAAQRAALDSYCPERVNLPNGQSAKITYAFGMDPFISVRVSHLFGIWETHPHARPETLANDQGSERLLADRLRADEKGSRRTLSQTSMAGRSSGVGRGRLSQKIIPNTFPQSHVAHLIPVLRSSHRRRAHRPLDVRAAGAGGNGQAPVPLRPRSLDARAGRQRRDSPRR
jgi:ATP-dependent helicase HrpB